MIARVWSARLGSQFLFSYRSHLAAVVFPKLQSIPGFVRAELYMRPLGEESDRQKPFTRPLRGELEIVVTTVWKDLESIDSFAYPDREAAVVAPEAAAILSDYDRRVRHYEISLTA